MMTPIHLNRLRLFMALSFAKVRAQPFDDFEV